MSKPSWRGKLLGLFTLVLGSLLLSFCVVFPAWGQPEKDLLHSLREEIRMLKKRVNNLEKKNVEPENRLQEQGQVVTDTSERLAESDKESQKPVVAKSTDIKKKFEEKAVKISGALKLDYAYKDFDEKNKGRDGDLSIRYFRLGVDANINDILLSAQYRWYSYMDTIHHGWIGYEFSDSLQLQFGITRVPFGILPYASHGWWEGIPYYLGLEDDYDLGLKLLFEQGPHDLRLAFFKNEEWGSSTRLNRRAYDVVRDTANFPDQDNEEINQLNARYAYAINHGERAHTELGISGQWGQLYNRTTESCGHHWAAGLHLNGNYGPVNLMLEGIRYEYDPKNPLGVNDKTILMGGFEDAYLVAAKGYVYVANLAYSLPVQWGPVTELTFYDDYSILVKDEGFHDSRINTLGCQISAKPVYVWLDFIMGNNAMYLGGPANSFAEGGDDENWNTRFNISVGYYF